MRVPAATIPRALWKPAEPLRGLCRRPVPQLDAPRCCSRCERQRPGRGRAPSGLEAVPAAAGDAQPLPSPSLSPPPHQRLLVPRGVSQLSPLPSSCGHEEPWGQRGSWCFRQRQEKFFLPGKLGTQVWFWEGRARGKAPPRFSHRHHRVGGSGGTRLCGRWSFRCHSHLPVLATPLPQPSRGWDVGTSTHCPPVPCSAAAPCPGTPAETGMLLLTPSSQPGQLGDPDTHPQSHCYPQILTETLYKPQILVGKCVYLPLSEHCFLLPPGPPSLPPQPACNGKVLRNKTISNVIKGRLVGVCLLGFPPLLLLSQRINIWEDSGVI